MRFNCLQFQTDCIDYTLDSIQGSSVCAVAALAMRSHGSLERVRRVDVIAETLSYFWTSRHNPCRSAMPAS
jgi:hypothetical protein